MLMQCIPYESCNTEKCMLTVAATDREWELNQSFPLLIHCARSSF